MAEEKDGNLGGASFRANDSIQEGILLSYISSIFSGNNVGGIGVLSLRGWILQEGEILAWKFLCTSSI